MRRRRLRHHPELAAVWLPRLASRSYRPALLPVAEKDGALCGMGMTEKQGGSDVRANTTWAEPTGDGPVSGAAYRLTGHKWFCSAPMSDGFLMLAQTSGGLTCFVVPRVLDDGTRNPFALQRLKDKLGNRSNASSELELDGTLGVTARRGGPWSPDDHRHGRRDPPRLRARLRRDDACGVDAGGPPRPSPVGLRGCLGRPAPHACCARRPRRRVGGGNLLGMRLARAVDEQESAFLRLAVAAAKFWVCKRTPPMVAEALECLGGNGYVEENGLARLYREAPLNSIWEGAGNVNALDVLRAVTREPLAVEALDKELSQARGLDRRLDAAVDRTLAAVRAAASADPVDAQLGARRLVQGRRGDPASRPAGAALRVAETFLGSRLGEQDGRVFGASPSARGRPRRSSTARSRTWQQRLARVRCQPSSGHKRTRSSSSRTSRPLTGRPLLPRRAVGQLPHDVEMSGVPGVLLDEVQQDPLQWWRPVTLHRSLGAPRSPRSCAITTARVCRPPTSNASSRSSTRSSGTRTTARHVLRPTGP